MSKRGLCITFEGPEGSGKSTQRRRLSSWLRRRGFDVVLTREPGGTVLGQRFRQILLDRRGAGIDPFVELCLYTASRHLLVKQVIQPALRRGDGIIVDRFQDSTWVYQGWAGGLNPALVGEMGHVATEGLAPDLTLLLDLPAADGLARVRHPNRMEAKPLAFHRKVREGYLALARREPKRFRVIRADRPILEVQRAIQKEVLDVLRRRRRA